MNETAPQPNQDINLSLERQEAVQLHNEILQEQENLSDPEKDQVIDKKSELSVLREKVGVIDKYKTLAKPFNDQYYYRVGDISSIEKLNNEKLRIDTEIEKVKKWIKDDTDTLNELRNKLGMEPSNDIPSLDIKKERLPYLLRIQDDLENALKLEIKKQEEELENSKREGRNTSMEIEDITFTIKKIASLLEERQSNGYNQIFSDEEALRTIAIKIGDSTNQEETRNNLVQLGNIVEDFFDNRGRGVNDDTESLYSMSNKLKQLASSLMELPQKLHSEEERKELSQITNSVAEKVGNAVSKIIRRAHAIEEFLR
jgi:hypothetical protein